MHNATEYRSQSLHFITVFTPFLFRAMLFPSALVAFSATLLPSVAVGAVLKRDLDSFINDQATISLKGVLGNIGGPEGKLVKEASKGVVIASPSLVNPNCM